MKFIIKKNILLENLLNTSKAISSKNLIPILTGIKFELLEEGLYLSASDSDISIRTFIDKDKIIFVSGRISCEMILKAAKSGIPIVISKSAPTNLSVEIAKKLNITLAGFVRGERMNIYTNPQRIIFE